MYNKAMKKFMAFLISVLLIIGCSKKIEIPSFDDISIKGIWFSYVDYRDLMQGLDEKEFKQKVDEVINNCEKIGINTIYLHTVAFTDAFYESKIYPKSFILGDIAYDPLRIFIKKAHNKGIRVEAWINPLRSFTKEEMEKVSDEYMIKQWFNEGKPYLKLVDNRYYLNLGYEESNDLIMDIIREIIDNYKIDGIHMDDYFYPENATEEFDKEIICENCDVGEFRKNNVNNLVSLINKEVKKNGLVFGISPSGNKEYSINTIYGDVDMWVDAGIVDYLIPQIYWGYNHPTKPYLKTMDEWINTVSNSDVSLIIGIAAYKVGMEDVYAKEGNMEWIENESILNNQYHDAINKGSKGISMFNYKSLFFPEEGVKDSVEKNINNLIMD